MASNEELKELIKLQRERNKLEKDIAQFSERAHKSVSEYFNQKKKVAEISKEIRDLEEQVSVAVGDEKAKLEANLKLRKELRDEIKKELSLVKAIANETKEKIVGALSSQTKHLKAGLSMYYDIDESVRKTSMSLGLSSSRMEALSQRSQNVANHFASLGLSSTEALEAQMAYNEEVGRTVMLSEQNLKNMADLGIKTGLGTQGIAQLAGEMESFGMGSTVAIKNIEGIRDTAQNMGINTGKVLKKVQQNMNLLNKLNFKGGVKGLGKMAAYAEKFKMDMGALAESAKAVWSPEGAIEAASSLQTLGGGFSKLADPFKLMFDARNDPEKYAQSITDSLQGIAKFKDGEFIVSAYEMQRLEEAGKALGFSGEQMAEMAKQQAKMEKIGGTLNFMPDKKDRELLTSLIEFDANGKAIIGDKALKDYNQEELKQLAQRQKTSEQNAKDAISARQQWEAITNQISSTFLPVMKALNNMIEGPLKTLSSWIEKHPVRTMVMAAGAMIIGKAAEWYLKGYSLGLGFNAATGKGGFFKALMSIPKKIGGGIKGLIGKITGKSPTEEISEKAKEVSEKSDKVGKSGGGAGESLKSLAGGLSAMGTPQVLFGAANLIPTAVGMVAMVPAIPSLMFLGMVKLKNLGSNLTEMAIGLGFMGTPQVLFGAANLIATAIGMLAMLPAIPTLLVLGLVPMAQLGTNLTAIGTGLTALGNPVALLGTATLAAAALGFTLMTAGAIGLAAIALGGVAAGVGLSAIATGLTALGSTFPIAGLGVVILLGLGAAMMMMGAAVYFVASGIALVVDSFTRMFSVINEDNIAPLMLLGPALMMTSLGVMSLAGSLLVMAGAMALGGWLGLIGLAATASTVKEAFQGIDGEGITKSVEAINKVDLEKIQALKELSMAMSLWGILGAKPIEIRMTVDGDIELSGESGGKKSTDWVNDPVFVSNLKDLIAQQMEKDKGGGGH